MRARRQGTRGRSHAEGDYGRGAQRSRFSFLSYAVYFIGVAVIATVSILSYLLILRASGSTLTASLCTAAILVVLSVALALTAAAWRRRVAEKPVREILAATQKMARGDFDINLKPRHIWGNYDEFDLIGENVNRLAKQLSETEMLRSDFMANVSHEIKTPLAVIQGYAGALLSAADGEERKKYAGVLVAASRRLTALVTDILKLSKMENNAILPEKQRIEGGELVRDCVLAFEAKMDEKDLQPDCDIDDMTLISDEGLLEIIFNNLISNAVKFSERGGTVYVSFKRQGDCALFGVRDEGCGMSAETGAHIFDKFYQGDTSHAAEGNGLGLAMVKRAIDMLGGEISVSSMPGEGSLFTVRLKGVVG